MGLFFRIHSNPLEVIKLTGSITFWDRLIKDKSSTLSLLIEGNNNNTPISPIPDPAK